MTLNAIHPRAWFLKYFKEKSARETHEYEGVR
jgi:hypothetical protein